MHVGYTLYIHTYTNKSAIQTALPNRTDLSIWGKLTQSHSNHPSCHSKGAVSFPVRQSKCSHLVRIAVIQLNIF